MSFMFGLCHMGNRPDLVREAGIKWIRYDMEWPFDCDGKIRDKFLMTDRIIRQYRKMGFQIMGITPFPGFSTKYEKGTTEYYENYQTGCCYLAKYYKDDVPVWQIGNEPNIPPFRQGLTLQEMYDFMEYGARGIRQGNPSSMIGINPAMGTEEVIAIYDEMYRKRDIGFDYAGIDGYPGSWEPGGPSTYEETILKIIDRVKKPIIIAEFGYSSVGDVMTESEFNQKENIDDVIRLMTDMRFFKPESQSLDTLDPNLIAKAIYLYKLHHYKKWATAWHTKHDPITQADFLEESFGIFTKHPDIIGAMWYCGKDSERCFWCKQEGCPCETGWGLFDVNDQPKPAFDRYRKVVKEYNTKNLK